MVQCVQKGACLQAEALSLVPAAHLWKRRVYKLLCALHKHTCRWLVVLVQRERREKQLVAAVALCLCLQGLELWRALSALNSSIARALDNPYET